MTISDIAKLAGVAKSTVSRYLNGGSVSPITKKRIENVIKDTGYIPNTFAQSLKARKTNIIGTVIPRLDSYAAAQTLSGIDEELRELNCQMLISNTSQDLDRELESIYGFARQKVAGIILMATQVTEAHLEAFEKIQIPVMLVGQLHQEVYSLVHQDYESGYEMGKYVLSKGHRKIAYLGVTEKDLAVGVRRKEGFKKAVEKLKDCDVSYHETSFNMMEALEQATVVIEEINPSIIVCATDNIALGVLKSALIKGLKIPEDLSITGFGGYDITEVIHPGLTTIKYFYKDAGRLAAKNIVKLVNGEEINKITYSNYKLIERESVDNRITVDL